MREIDELRGLTAGRVLELWRESREAAEDPLERVLLCNGGILAACCRFRGERVYASAGEALADLTPWEMETLLGRLAEGNGVPAASAAPAAAKNPGFDPARFQALKEG